MKKECFTVCRYSFSPSGLYHVPEEVEYDSCLKYILALPLYPSPEVFGLHDNADITKDNKESLQVYDLLLLVVETAIISAARISDF